MTDLSGRVVVVTGGNSGIGRGVAVGVGASGATVVLWARDARRNAETVEELAGQGISASAIECDITDESAVTRAVEQTTERHGRIDTLFANAGIAGAATLVDTTLDDWRRVLRTNLDGTFLCCREVARHLVKRGEGGAMVVVSSSISRYGGAGLAAYATSKSGLIGLGRTLAVELARHRVRVNMLIPGWVQTPMNDEMRSNDQLVAATTARTPVRRWGTPGDFHAVAAFLSDPTLTFHTGNEIVVDGGYTIF